MIRQIQITEWSEVSYKTEVINKISEKICENIAAEDERAEWDVVEHNKSVKPVSHDVTGGFGKGDTIVTGGKTHKVTCELLGELETNYCSIENAMVKQKRDNNN